MNVTNTLNNKIYNPLGTNRKDCVTTSSVNDVKNERDSCYEEEVITQLAYYISQTDDNIKLDARHLENYLAKNVADIESKELNDAAKLILSIAETDVNKFEEVANEIVSQVIPRTNKITNIAILYVMLSVDTIIAASKQISYNTQKSLDLQKVMDKFQSLMLLNAQLTSRSAATWQIKQLADAKNGSGSANNTNILNFNDIANSPSHGLNEQDGVIMHQFLNISALTGNWGGWEGNRFAHNPLVITLVSLGLINVNVKPPMRDASGKLNLDQDFSRIFGDGPVSFPAGKSSEIDLFKLNPQDRKKLIDAVEANKQLASKSNGSQATNPVDGKSYETSDYASNEIGLGDVTYDLPELIDANGAKIDIAGKYLISAENVPSDFPVYTDQKSGRKYAALTTDILTNYIKNCIADFCRTVGQNPEDLQDSFINGFTGSIGELSQVNATLQNKLSYLQQSIQSLNEQIKGLKSSIDACKDNLQQSINNYNVH